MANVNSLQVNASQNGCTAVVVCEKLTESLRKSPEIDESHMSGKDMQESLKNSIKSEGIVRPKYAACVRVEEPDVKARNYLEENQIVRILETLLTKLVCHQPDDPLEFLAKEMEQLKTADLQGNKHVDSSGI